MISRKQLRKVGHCGNIAQHVCVVRDRCKSLQRIMKEDKENTRPREKKVEIKCDENEKLEKPSKEKKEAMTKVNNVVSKLAGYAPPINAL